MDYHLLTFVTVAEKLNFTRAAESLHITQSAVTLSIKALEKKYNVTFLDRTNKYVRLTKAGELFYFHAKKILSEYKEVNNLIDYLSKTKSRPLSIGSSFTFGEYLLPKVIADYIKKDKKHDNPMISIRNSNRIIDQLLHGEIDLGIIDSHLKHHPHLSITPFKEDELVIIVSKNHRFASLSSIELKYLYDETWILREEGSGTREVVNQFFQNQNFDPPSVRSFGSTQIIKESVEADLGISIVSKYAVQKEMFMDTLSILRIKNVPIIRYFSFIVPEFSFKQHAVSPLITELTKENKLYQNLSYGE
ncbi:MULTISPECIES: LysR family transcriptional regulator [unclassified Bacillus (in: firmicutes)]|uniref:LysR family transcriptional regulator n=1 Tax=unclassified Bacillus (in: firmicutes) TaxID=185979 RepID=UPI0004E0B5FA|nr:MULTISPECIES: LysR family transcriptional regulator [unclassified Bacillus (in: firmicutes)]